MSKLLTDPVDDVGLPLLIGFCIVLIILAIRDMRDIKNITLEEAYTLVRRSKEYQPMLAALIVVNIFASTVARPSLEDIFSLRALFYATLIADSFVVLITIGTFIRTSLARKRIRTLEEQSDTK